MVLPRFHPFPVEPRPPSVILSLFPFTLSFSRSCDLPIPVRGNSPRAKACILPFVCFGIYRASRFSSTSKKRDRIRFRRNRSRFSTTVIDERSARMNLLAHRCERRANRNIYRYDILAESTVSSTLGFSDDAKGEIG